MSIDYEADNLITTTRRFFPRYNWQSQLVYRFVKPTLVHRKL